MSENRIMKSVKNYLKRRRCKKEEVKFGQSTLYAYMEISQ
jgi:hypothetical protein